MLLIQNRFATSDSWRGPLGDKSQGRLNLQGQSFGPSRGREAGWGDDSHTIPQPRRPRGRRLRLFSAWRDQWDINHTPAP